ncbi:S8 family serine peptidase [Massilia norwichensis]|uniref:S8 family serine peptidase n=1 Tax=Massilia norwichensis TaxID=1442366 RepID=A0ABT2A5B3_9BURK|nr:S8 family serine peptidase [Massilia norwichensis]MCS0589369.1 S8 family serine peptidase [Massilia norwichensis]
MKMRPLSAAVALLLAGFAASVQADDLRRPYIVQLADKPVSSYTGEIAGLPATQPAPGARLDVDSTDVQLYSDYLGQKQQIVRASIADAPVLYNYSVVLNGFAALLTDDEVRALQLRSDVAAITPDTPRQVTTTYTSRFLGLDKSDGLWTRLGGKTKAGENIIIGIVDGGIWPENPAYADRVDADGKPTFDNNGTLAYDAPPARWKGICQPGEGFTVAACNNKLIGAQYFDATYSTVGKTTHWTEFRSPRDSIGGNVGHGGHGDHTASTAGGNSGAEAIVNGVNLGPVSGMAPRARLAAYKVCWTYNEPTDPTGGKNSCYTGDSVAAIEKAVVDGVNVINFSISGGTSVTDPVEQAFFHASNAGVFVSASAGNDGPANQVAHISPWQATVAASTHDRELQSDVILGNGNRYTGASMIVNPLPAAPMITAEQAALPGSSANSASLCYSSTWTSPDWTVAKPSLDPAKVAGKIVTCTRGTNDRLDKSKAVKEAGGVGMVLIDNGAGLVGEVHNVPTVHVTAANGAIIKTYAASQGASASMTKFVTGTSSVKAPVVASFSSRGPNRYDGNQLKPDLAAPGVDIIAAVTPEMTPAQRADVVNGTAAPMNAWASYQGTSMAAPHVAGIAALLKQQHPDWTPAMIKSALMTSATDTFADTQAGDLRGTLAFGQGAGHINPNGASDPGLVFNAMQADYQKYLCGLGVSSNCAGGSIAGYNLNLPSIAVGNVLGTVTVTRTVTNVGASAATYTPGGSMQGFSMSVSPATLVLQPGESKSFNLTLTRTNAANNTWQYGSLRWSDGAGHVVRIPVVARSGQPVIAPGLIASTKASGMKTLSVTTGFTGTLGSAFGGLKEITKTNDTVAQAPAGSVDNAAQMQTACRASINGVRVTNVTIPTGTLLAQFELFNRDTEGGNIANGTDLDLAVLNPSGTVVAYSGNGGSNELAALNAPVAGTYKVCVAGWKAANGASASYALSSAVVTSSDRGGNFKVLMPAKVYAGSAASLTASWSNLATGKRFVGALQLKDTAGAPAATTVFQVETNNPIPLGEPVDRDAVVRQDSGI